MKGSFLKTKRTDRGFIRIWMEQSMSGSGKTTNRMEMEWKPGMMALTMKGNMRMGRNMDTERFSLQTGVGMMGIFMKMNFTERELNSGAMGGNTLENSKKIKWMGREALPGRTGGAMKEIILKIKSRATECLNGLMGRAMKACDSMESNTDKEFI